MTKAIGPDPNQIYPLQPYNKLIFLKKFIKASNIHIGDYTYFDDRRYGPENFEGYNVLYNYDFSNDIQKINKNLSLICSLDVNCLEEANNQE